MSIDITNHLIPWAIAKRMQADAWDEGYDAGALDAMDNFSVIGEHDCTPNPHRENK